MLEHFISKYHMVKKFTSRAMHGRMPVGVQYLPFGTVTNSSSCTDVCQFLYFFSLCQISMSNAQSRFSHSAAYCTFRSRSQNTQRFDFLFLFFSLSHMSILTMLSKIFRTTMKLFAPATTLDERPENLDHCQRFICTLITD